MKDMTDTKQAKSVSSRIADVATIFLRLGMVAFGGPYAHVGMMEREAVHRLAWLDGDRYAEGLAVCQALPGPMSTQLAIWLGWVRAGWLGGIVAGVCFILPACLMVLAFAVLYFRYGARLPAVDTVFYGVNAAVIAIILSTCWRMKQTAVKDKYAAAIASAA